jgi:hypothetical protein
MSEEQKVSKTDETDDQVEGHAHRVSMNDEPAAETDDEVEAHSHRTDGRTDGRTDARPD